MTRSTLLALVLGVVASAAASPLAAQRGRPDTTDNFQWLEDVNGNRAMTWVKAENAKTINVLEKDRRFAALYRDALSLAEASDRIPYASFIGGQLYNFWQDSAHVRGIWRRTSLVSYRSTNSTEWVTVFDLDSLAKAEGKNWVWKGADCAWPAERRCMVFLSEGGEDAVAAREFDLSTRKLNSSGFNLPRAKLRLTWQGEDTLLVASEWKPGELTKSGYPYIVKRFVRGQPLGREAEIFRGDANDGGYGVTPTTIGDGAGHRITIIDRPVSTFESEKYIVRAKDVAKLSMPLKSSPVGMVAGQVIVQLSDAWSSAATKIITGSVASFEATAAMSNPANLSPVIVFEPGPRESVSSAVPTRDRLLIGAYQNVNGRVFLATPSLKGNWTRGTALTLPKGVSSEVQTANLMGDEGLISVTGFLTPSSVWQASAKNGAVMKVKTLPPKFDASPFVVEQLEATSKDGTKVPYFIVHHRNMNRDGSNPTILYAYGGFEVSMTPNYSAPLGKLWLERGGVYVLANIRGGGEFGPAWHEAGLKTKRQVIYDDFAAVAQDLIAKKITTPRRLGIEGGSNGGLLMGVEMTQHPELWNAVDIQVPLLDMLRFEQIAAGTSWVGEYGSVSKPDERAFLASISPYHNLVPGVTYPEPLVWTTTKDDRVGPQHARKFAAKLSAMGIPYMFYEVIEGGHGAGANLKQRAHTTALEFTYFARRLMDADAKLTP